MFENPRRGKQARNFTTNVPKILDLKSSSEQIFSRKLSLGAPDDCHTSDCLNIITNINNKKTLNKFRLSNHRLQIETGRHTVPKIPENLRICPFCHLNEVEHELHFLFNCSLYDSLWSNFYRNITNRYPLFNNFNNEKPSSYLTKSILISTDLQLLTYIHACMEYRQKLVL